MMARSRFGMGFALVILASARKDSGVFFQCGAVLVADGAAEDLWRLAEELAGSLRKAGVTLPSPAEAMVDEASSTVWLLVPSLAPNLRGAQAPEFRATLERWARSVHFAGAFQNSDEGGDVLITFGAEPPARIEGERFALVDELGASPLYDDLVPQPLST